MRHFVVAVVSFLASLALTPPLVVEAAPCWRPPVIGSVIDPFRAPTCPYCAGNRGIEYQVGQSTPVRAVAAGTVTYSGTIAGVRYVVVQHGNGWKITYGKLVSSALRRGDEVAARTLIGRASGRAYFGLRIGGRYRDPAPFLGIAVGRARLIPVDGSQRRPAPRPVWRCTG